MDNTDFDMMFNMPSGDDFREVTDVFKEASRDMEPGGMVFIDGFSLQDAMSVLEIGEPRLDSGLALQEEHKPPFDPLFPMLPQEICWVLDRSFACEMEWHAGNTLSQTIYTLLYIHHLPEFNPEFIPLASMRRGDPNRPPELITIVLRSGVLGLLKCCGLAWQELVREKVHDCEDWQSEKCEISLLENIPTTYIISKLDEACAWIHSQSKVMTQPWQDALLSRLLLRKALLDIIDCDIYKETSRFRVSLSAAREQLQNTRKQAYPEPPADSQVHNAFDPYIARRLNTFGPLRKHILPAQDKVWDAMQCFLDDCEEVMVLSGTRCITTWDIVGNLRAWSSQERVKFPYIRSTTQSVFYNGVLILNRFSLSWTVDKFFLETLDLPYADFSRNIRQRWVGSHEPPLREIERLISKLITGHIKALYQNPPRRRRLFMKSLFDWHVLYDILLYTVSSLKPSQDEDEDDFQYVPNAAIAWRLSIVRDVVLSGLQLDLYTMDERAFAYWYLAQVVDEHLDCLRDILPVVSRESGAHHEMTFQLEFLAALNTMSMAMFAVTSKTISLPLQQLQLNFFRRYKWAFRPAYEAFKADVVAPPNLSTFLAAREDLLKSNDFSPSGSINLAKDKLQQTIASHPLAGWSEVWHRDRLQFLRGLINACDKLYGIPESMDALPTFDLNNLKWDTHTHPWFPYMISNNNQ